MFTQYKVLFLKSFLLQSESHHHSNLPKYATLICDLDSCRHDTMPTCMHNYTHIGIDPVASEFWMHVRYSRDSAVFAFGVVRFALHVGRDIWWYRFHVTSYCTSIDIKRRSSFRCEQRTAHGASVCVGTHHRRSSGHRCLRRRSSRLY